MITDPEETLRFEKIKLALFAFGFFLFLMALPLCTKYLIESQIIEISEDIGLENFESTNIEITLAESCSKFSEKSKFEVSCKAFNILKNVKLMNEFQIAFSLVYSLIFFIGFLFSLSSRKIAIYFYGTFLIFTKVSIPLIVFCLGISLASLAVLLTKDLFAILIVSFVFFPILLYACISIAYRLFKSTSKRTPFLMGFVLEKENHPALWHLVTEVCQKLNSALPDQIILGMFPSFFVTEEEIRNVTQTITGRTLYLPCQFCRILEPDELKAVIAHEIAHFVGGDTTMGSKFLKIYDDSQNVLNELYNYKSKLLISRRHFNTANPFLAISKLALFLAVLPSSFVMHIFLSCYETSEKRMRREREFEADRLASELAGAKHLAVALIRLHMNQRFWKKLVEISDEKYFDDQQITNMSHFFFAKGAIMSLKFHQFGISKDEMIEHPFDTHPTIELRLQRIGYSLSKSSIDALEKPFKNSSIQLVSNYQNLECQLTNFEYMRACAMREMVVDFFPIDKKDLIFLRCGILFYLSHKPNLDHIEIYLKSAFNSGINKDFTKVEIFREVYLVLWHRINLWEYLEEVSFLLDSEEKSEIKKLLILIAHLPNDPTDLENQSLLRFAKIFKLPIYKLEDEQLGTRLRYSNHDKSVFRRYLTKEVEKESLESVKSVDRAYNRIMSIACSFDLPSLNGVSNTELGRMADIAIFEIGCFIFTKLALSKPNPDVEKQNSSCLQKFLYISSLIFKIEEKQVREILAIRMKLYGILDALPKKIGEIRTLSEFIANSIESKTPIATSVINSKTFEGSIFSNQTEKWFLERAPEFALKYKWVNLETVRWHSKFTPNIAKLSEAKSSFEE